MMPITMMTISVQPTDQRLGH